MNNPGFTTGQIRAFDPAEAERSRTVEFVISDGSRDRYHTRLNPRGWQLEQYNANPVVGYQHNLYGDMCNAPNPDDVIGSGRAWLEGEQLIGSVTFEPADINPLAEKIFRKILMGTLRATSVGFQPLMGPDGKYGRWGDGDEAEGMPNETYYYAGQSLMEFSVVNIPANPNALKRSVRDQSAHALMYLRRATGLSFADIERLTVRDVLERLEGRKVEREEDVLEVPFTAVAEVATARTALDATDIRAALRDAVIDPTERMREAIREALKL